MARQDVSEKGCKEKSWGLRPNSLEECEARRPEAEHPREKSRKVSMTI